MKNSIFSSIEKHPTTFALLIAGSIAALVFGPHLFDQLVPIEGDVRAHIFKIAQYNEALTNGSWPGWTQYWYQGLPLGQYYPPGFYFLGALIEIIVGSSVVAYKLLLFISLVTNGLASYVFAKKILKFDQFTSLICMVAYQTSTALLINYLYGEGPNLLGWSLCLWFMIIIFNKLLANRLTFTDSLIPGLMLGLTILIHPFPVVFAALAVGVYMIVSIFGGKIRLADFPRLLRYLIYIMAISLLVGAHYWIPAVLTFHFASPIYVYTVGFWPAGVPFLVWLILLALVSGVIFRKRLADAFWVNVLIGLLLVSLVLGFGGTRFIPGDFGTFLHEFRFATMMAPLFSVYLIGFALNQRETAYGLHFTRSDGWLSLLVILPVYVVGGLIIFSAYYQEENFWKAILNTYLSLVIIIAPTFIVIHSILSSTIKNTDSPFRMDLRLVLAFSLILITTVLPAASTWESSGLTRIFQYVENYRQSQYEEILDQIDEGRLIVPPYAGFLGEGDSFVTFGWQQGVETVNGPYNQGDPKFFSLTVHLEWEERWLSFPYSLENLMQESGAKYLFVRDSHSLLSFGTAEVIDPILDDSYGILYEINESVARAVHVTPILLDVNDPQMVTEIFNIMLPDGYRYVFVDKAVVSDDLLEEFEYVFVDDIDELEQYSNHTRVFLNDIPYEQESSVTDSNNNMVISLPFTHIYETNFYLGDQGYSKGWNDFDFDTPYSQLVRIFDYLDDIALDVESILDRLEYSPAQYQYSNNQIEVQSNPGFTLIKDSYFPYWQGDNLVSTTQGLMLVKSDTGKIELTYDKPLINGIAGLITVISLFGLSIGQIVVSLRRRADRVKQALSKP
ncbi:hypothetical protein ABFB09_01895 [Dehalogenimonas sp. THU2]|uniref:hypothetical protein n=1 Tax=Dehalogenimonas sp. THU2 TaxID=3151121 RepID=UPI0032188715